GADRPGAGGDRLPRGGHGEQADRPGTGHLGTHGHRARVEPAAQDGCHLPHRGRAVGGSAGSQGHSSVLIERRSSIAAYASATWSIGSCRSKTSLASSEPSSTSPSSSGRYGRTGATPPATAMLLLNLCWIGSSAPPSGTPT